MDFIEGEVKALRELRERGGTLDMGEADGGRLVILMLQNQAAAARGHLNGVPRMAQRGSQRLEREASVSEDTLHLVACANEERDLGGPILGEALDTIVDAARVARLPVGARLAVEDGELSRRLI